MRILIDLNHPKDVNIFRNVISIFEEKGYKIKLVAANKENVLDILDDYELKYEVKKHYKGLLRKAIGMLQNDYLIYKIAKKFKPDIFASFGSPYAAQVSKMFGKKHISFSDTDTNITTVNHFGITTLFFSEVDYVPLCHKKNRGPKQKKFNGYYELAYLHPKYFIPNNDIFKMLCLSQNDRYIILRFSALNAHHDIGAHGFDFRTEQEIRDFIVSLEKYGTVFITSEVKLSDELESYKAKIPSTDFHSFMYHSSLYIGEGASMASEAAVLGVPSIYVSNTTRGYLNELEHKYDLVYTISDKDKALEKAVSLLKINVKDEWKQKKEKMLRDKVDTTEFIVDVLENYMEC